LGSGFGSLRSDAVPQWRRGGASDDAPERTKPGALGRRKPVGAPTPGPADGGAAQSRGWVGVAQSRARS
jgi:hypothetical protein